MRQPGVDGAVGAAGGGRRQDGGGGAVVVLPEDDAAQPGPRSGRGLAPPLARRGLCLGLLFSGYGGLPAGGGGGEGGGREAVTVVVQVEECLSPGRGARRERGGRARRSWSRRSWAGSSLGRSRRGCSRGADLPENGRRRRLGCGPVLPRGGCQCHLGDSPSRAYAARALLRQRSRGYSVADGHLRHGHLVLLRHVQAGAPVQLGVHLLRPDLRGWILLHRGLLTILLLFVLVAVDLGDSRRLLLLLFLDAV